MLILAPIVFVGIIGNQHEAVERQLEPSLEKVGVTEMAIPDGARVSLVKHTKNAKQVVKSLHVGGVIAGQLTGKGNDRSFRVIIYDGEGNLTSDLESPVGGKKLTQHNIDVFESNIADIAASGSPAPAPSHAPVAVKDEEDTTASADAPAVVAQAPDKAGGGHAVHVQVGLLVGMVGRSIATDPNTIKTYSSTPVGTGGLEGQISIGSRVWAGGSFEHTLVMHSAVGANNAMTAASDIGRAEGVVGFNLLKGSVQVAPVVGVGERYFAIDSTETDRTADLQYVYALLGATVGKQLSSRWTLHGNAAFEPVITGLRPASLPEPSRWGVDVGAGLDLKATAHVFARAAFDYQVFQSSYTTGNTVDSYYGGSIAAGAAF